MNSVVTINLNSCPLCGQDHKLKAYKMVSQPGRWYSWCPGTGKEIFFTQNVPDDQVPSTATIEGPGKPESEIV